MRFSRLNTALGLTLSLLTQSPVGITPVKNHPEPGAPTLVFPQFVIGQALHFVAYGDTRFTDPTVTTGTNPRVRHWLTERIAQQHPKFILLTGDTPFHGALDGDWAEFQRETVSWREEGAIQLPTTGNHEVYGGGEAGIANYLKNFPDISGNRYYSALLGSVEVISLDYTQASDATSTQGRWFAAELNHVPAQVEFLLILYHLPWMADRQSQLLIDLPTKDALGLRTMLETRLAKIHAKVVVFNGHIHNYERFERGGVEYVITGGGGAEPYPLLFRGAGDLYRDTGFPVYHYLVVDVANHTLHAVMWKVKDPDANPLEDEVKDQFTIVADSGSLKRQSPDRRRTHASPD
jgi:hypothetical protein